MQTELDKLREENQKLKEEIEKLKNERGKNQKKGMNKQASLGKIVSRAPFGYSVLENQLIKDDERAKIVEDIFRDFLSEDFSLNKLAKKYNFSVNGIKKILTNFTYLGKIKFDNKIHEGTHEPIINSILFNHVQDKLEKILKKK